mgnify:FL=1
MRKEPTHPKKPIEVALPLEAINRASAREKSIRHGHPSTLHPWWARRPLAAARAVIFAKMVDEPGSVPEEFPTPEEKESERLFRLIEELVRWENTTNEEVLNRARAEIRRSWARWCNKSGEDLEKLPPFHDPFAGCRALPLEAQRLGLEAHASDLNPVAVMINKAMIEIPPRFAGKPPVNQESGKDKRLFEKMRQGAQGLAEDVRYYGKWMRDEAEKRIGHLYPKAKVTAEMAEDRPDLKPYVGRELTVIAWLRARTVESSNPAYRGCHVPPVSSFRLSTKPGKEAWIEVEKAGASVYRFIVRTGTPANTAAVDAGTKLGRGANFRCVLLRRAARAELHQGRGAGWPHGRASHGRRLRSQPRPHLSSADRGARGHCPSGEAGVGAGGRCPSATYRRHMLWVRPHNMGVALHPPPIGGADDLFRSCGRGAGKDS